MQKKKSALFEVAEVVPVMTNNYEENILKGVKDSSYSLESSLELFQKDVVQLHAPRYQSMRRVRNVRSWGVNCHFIIWLESTTMKFYRHQGLQILYVRVSGHNSQINKNLYIVTVFPQTCATFIKHWFT